MPYFTITASTVSVEAGIQSIIYSVIKRGDSEFFFVGGQKTVLANPAKQLKVMMVNEAQNDKI